MALFNWKLNSLDWTEMELTSDFVCSICLIYSIYLSCISVSQAVAPFGVSTPMTGYQKPNMVTLTAEDFVRSSLEYLLAGDKTYGSICHTVLVNHIRTFTHMESRSIYLVFSHWNRCVCALCVVFTGLDGTGCSSADPPQWDHAGQSTRVCEEKSGDIGHRRSTATHALFYHHVLYACL